jgi:hypothetical protein
LSKVERCAPTTKKFTLNLLDFGRSERNVLPTCVTLGPFSANRNTNFKKERQMKRILVVVAVVVLCFALSGLTLAQNSADPRVGTWKLNLAKSNFVGMPAPKSLTRTIEAHGQGEKITYKGVAPDGSPIAFSITTNLDGKPVPFVGTGVAGGADTDAPKRIDSHTVTTTTTKAGKVGGERTICSCKRREDYNPNDKRNGCQGPAVYARTYLG